MSLQLSGSTLTPLFKINPSADPRGTMLASFEGGGLEVRLLKVAHGYELRVGSLGRCYGLRYGPADECAAWDMYHWVTEPA